MLLNHSPAPEFFICNKKVFLQGEEHITRISERSVLILMISGTLRFLENGSEISLEAGDYYIQRQQLLQQGIPLSDPPVYYYVEFFGSFSDGDAGLDLRGRYDAARVLRLAEQLCEATKAKSCNPFTLSAYMYRIFGELSGDNRSRNSTATLVKSYLESEYASEISMQQLAKKFGYTEDYLTRIFKKEFCITPHRHLINTRMEHALWLLENTDIPAERVASSVGYGDFSAFWRAFKARYKLSPGEIRKKQIVSSI
ncbi:MAG: helix-turn-helix transcriptional regulator [Clostridia bacterium]|nr:helix-turn-helix transcriptional regulator [Clostridia bacterium]